MSSGQADFNVEDFEARDAADKNTHARFFLHPMLNQEKSDAAGRPIYEDTEYVEIYTPGNQTNVPRRPARQMDRDRFHRQYRLFKQGDEVQQVGTPLSVVPWLTRSQVEELKFFRITSVEALAEVNDDVCTRMPGLFKLKQRAQDMVAKAEKSAPFIAMQQKNEELESRLATMEQALAEQTQLIKDLKAKK